MEEGRVIYSWNDNHQCAHYWNDDTEHSPAEIESPQVVEDVGYDQNKNGDNDHFCQI